MIILVVTFNFFEKMVNCGMVSVLFIIGMEFTGEISINVGVTKGKKVVCDNVKFFC